MEIKKENGSYNITWKTLSDEQKKICQSARMLYFDSNRVPIKDERSFIRLFLIPSIKIDDFFDKAYNETFGDGENIQTKDYKKDFLKLWLRTFADTNFDQGVSNDLANIYKTFIKNYKKKKKPFPSHEDTCKFFEKLKELGASKIEERIELDQLKKSCIDNKKKVIEMYNSKGSNKRRIKSFFDTFTTTTTITEFIDAQARIKMDVKKILELLNNSEPQDSFEGLIPSLPSYDKLSLGDKGLVLNKQKSPEHYEQMHQLFKSLNNYKIKSPDGYKTYESELKNEIGIERNECNKKISPSG